MTASRASLAAGIVLGAVLLCAAHGWGQESEADKRATLKRIAGYAALIDKTEVEIQRKRWEYRTLLALVLTVGIMGAASAAAQKFEGTKARLCTLTMGVVISAVTFATNTFFPDDHRALKRNIDRARHERDVGKVVADSADLSASGEALLQLEQQVQARYASIVAALGPDTRRASLAPTSAWAAAPGAPESAECQRWASAGSMCFSGIGRSLYPEQARQNALQVAVDRASQYVARQAGGRRPPESFREYVERFGRAEEVYPSRELRTGKEFAYVAIVTLNQRFADPKALAALQHRAADHRCRRPGADPRVASAGRRVGAARRGGRGLAPDRRPGAPLGSGRGRGELVGLRQARRDARATPERRRGVAPRRVGGPLRDGRVRRAALAFRGPAEATLFRLEKRGGSPAELIREGDGFALVDARSGKILQAERGRVTTGPAGDGPATRFASVLVPRIGAGAKY